MADYRQIHTHIWKDGWFLDLPSDEKLLFIYLFSNERASVAGIYELALRVMSFETSQEQAKIAKTLERFSKAGKVHYQGGIVWVVNMRKYNANPSPRVHDRICADLAKIPDCPLKRSYIAYFDPIQSVPYRPDTVPIPYQPVSTEQEQEKEQEQEQNNKGADAPTPPVVEPLTEGQALFLQAFKAKRFKNDIQRSAVLAMETTYGVDRLRECVAWAAKRGMGLGEAVSAIEKAIPKWGAPKPVNGATAQARSMSALEQFVEAERGRTR